MLINPWLDWQVAENWLLKFGAAFQFSSMDQTTREPYAGKGDELLDYYDTGLWMSGNKYMTSQFSESKSLLRSYSIYGRSVYDSEFDFGMKNSLLTQIDTRHQEGSVFSALTTRYGITLQDSVSHGWITLLGGAAYI